MLWKLDYDLGHEWIDKCQMVTDYAWIMNLIQNLDLTYVWIGVGLVGNKAKFNPDFAVSMKMCVSDFKKLSKYYKKMLKTTKRQFV